MIKIARVEDGNIMEIREIEKMTEIGKHKRHLWMKIVDNPPTYDNFYQELEGPTRSINEKTITMRYVLKDRSKDFFNMLIGAEEQKRILNIISISEMTELLLLVASGEDLDDHFLAILDKVEVLKQKAHDLKIQDKLPKDFRDNKYWQ